MIRKIADTLLSWNGDKTSLELHRELRKAYTEQNKLKTKNNTLTYTNKILERRLERANNVLEQNDKVLERYEERIKRLINKARETTHLVDIYEDAIHQNNPRLKNEKIQKVKEKQRKILNEINKAEKRKEQQLKPPQRVLL